jgi:hypothetical protein
MRFQKRDGAILQALYDYDGLLAKRHLKEMFWADATQRAMELRLSPLHHQGYLDWPNDEQRRTNPGPKTVCWLGWKGMIWVAGQSGLALESPPTINETQLRNLERQLRTHGIRWLREPRWNQLEHDLAIIDFRLAVEKAVRELPGLRLESWIPEGAFLSQMDVVEYQLTDRTGESKRVRKGVRPDGYFVVVDEKRQSQGLPARARFLLEVDMATHDTGSFAREKILAGLAYIQSPAYKTRFGENRGRWLVVTTSEVRLKHLLRETQQVAGAQAFLFTTFDHLRSGNILARPIWQQPGANELVTLFSR